jgi:hypothetical protein
MIAGSIADFEHGFRYAHREYQAYNIDIWRLSDAFG